MVNNCAKCTGCNSTCREKVKCFPKTEWSRKTRKSYECECSPEILGITVFDMLKGGDRCPSPGHSWRAFKDLCDAIRPIHDSPVSPIDYLPQAARTPYPVTHRSPYTCARVRGIREDLRMVPGHSPYFRDHLPRAARRILQDYPHFQGDRLVSLLNMTGFPLVTEGEAELLCRLTRAVLKNGSSASNSVFFALHELPRASVHQWDCQAVRRSLHEFMVADPSKLGEVLGQYIDDPSSYAQGLVWICRDALIW